MEPQDEAKGSFATACRHRCLSRDCDGFLTLLGTGRQSVRLRSRHGGDNRSKDRLAKELRQLGNGMPCEHERQKFCQQECNFHVASADIISRLNRFAMGMNGR